MTVGYGFPGSEYTGGAFGQCQLAYVSTTEIKLSPFGGNKILINGKLVTLPSTGISLANTGLTAATLYYVYASGVTGAVLLEASTISPSTDTATGIKIKTNDATRTLVGLVYMDAGTPGTFADTDSKRYVRGWFNDAGVKGLNTFTALRSTASTTYVQVNSEILIGFLAWANEIVSASLDGSYYSGLSGDNVASAIAFNSTTVAEPGFETNSYIASGGIPVPLCIAGTKIIASDGFNYVTVLGKVVSGTATFHGTATSATAAKVYLHVSTAGINR